MQILAIDPGVDQGWCLMSRFRVLGTIEETKYQCGLGDPPIPIFENTNILIECPQVYRADRSKADPNDLIKLAIRVGRLIERAEHNGLKNVRLVYPREWKGQQNKNVTKNRMLKKYPDLAQRLLNVPASKIHNVYDAVGIADWGLDHLDRAWKF